ncbi:hypothetical protein ACR3IL_03435 [Streptococcus iniae]|uniref:hypothetical protein n=1 Tax=Streptococcus iniae TaxID=1346 RepID=UPI000AD58B5F|nr:hypothetical protein [Streptococcus iniae]
MSSRVTALNNAITQLSTFAGATTLQGTAYDNAKGYATATLTPMIQAMILYAESLSEKCTELQTLYASICGSEDLDSTVLEAKLSSDRGSLRIAEALLDRLADDPKPSRAAIRSTQGNIERLHKRIRSNQKKLDNLNRFNAQSATVFADIMSAQNTVSQALTAVAAGFSGYNSTTGTFGKPAAGQMDWKKTVKSSWENRAELKSEYKNVLSKIKSGQPINKKDAQTLSTFAKKHPNVKVPEYVISYFENNGIIENAKAEFSGVKTYGSLTRDLVVASRIEIKGNAVVINHGTTTTDKIVNKAFGLEKEFNTGRVTRGYDFSYITGDSGNKINHDYKDFAKKGGFSAKGQLYNGGKTDLDGVKLSTTNATKAAVKSGIKSGITLGVSDATEAFKSGGTTVKSVALLNVASTAIDVKNGIDTTHNMAINKGIVKGSSDYVEAQAGGIAIDIAKGTAVGAASAAGGALAVAAIGTASVAALPAVAVVAVSVGAGFLVTQALNTLDEKFNLTNKAKTWWINTIKD